jgi:hypothetical protein
MIVAILEAVTASGVSMVLLLEKNNYEQVSGQTISKILSTLFHTPFLLFANSIIIFLDDLLQNCLCVGCLFSRTINLFKTEKHVSVIGKANKRFALNIKLLLFFLFELISEND